MHLTRDEEAGLHGEQGEIMQMAYRILVATGEATDAHKLIPIKWAHLAGVNYNTIGDAGQEFLAGIAAKGARVKVRTTLNPMGFDIDSVSDYIQDEDFVSKQLSIKESYKAMGVNLSFSCIPYEIFDMPAKGAQVAFAESNAAIHANSYDGLRTNKESALSALASAITGKSPYSSLRMGGEGNDRQDGTMEDQSDITVRMKIDQPDEMTYGMLGYFAGKVGDKAVRITGINEDGAGMNRRQCKAMCGGMGTSGTCAKFLFGNKPDDASSSSRGEEVDFDQKELNNVHDELNTAEKGDLITLGSPQLGFEEIMDLVARLKGRSFIKRCLIFCPRTVKEQVAKAGHVDHLQRAGCEILADCCTCLSPLINKDQMDSVTTNSIKGAFYMKNFSGVGVNLKPLEEIIRDETD